MADPVVHITGGLPDSGTGNITTLGQVFDPTNGPAAIKAASSGAALATDKAMVVTLRDTLPAGQAVMGASAPVVIASDQSVVPVGGKTITCTGTTLTRAATTPTYASGQLVANSTTPGSVTNITFASAARVNSGSGVIVGAALQKSGNTTTGAAFRLHLFTVQPTYTSAGDGSAISSVVVALAKGYLGYIDFPTMVAFSDVGWSSGAPDNTRGSIPFVAVVQTLYGLLEARGAYVGVSGESFIPILDILQD